LEKQNTFVLWFDELGIEDVPLVGGKNASLGEMYRNLVPKGVPIPNGFAVTAHAYRHLLKASGAMNKIKGIMDGLDTHDMDNLMERGSRIRALIRNLEIPADLQGAIIQGRSETVHSQNDLAILRKYVLKEKGETLVEGQSVGELIGQGPVQVIKSAGMIHTFRKGEILVTDMTDPDWEPIRKNGAGHSMS